MAKLTKAEILQKLKEHSFSEKDKEKRAELIEAIKNATETDIELVEYTATLQVGYITINFTAEGTTKPDVNGNYTNRTINQEINTGRHIWFIDGDDRVAIKSEMRNGFSNSSTREMGFGLHKYRSGNEKNIASEFAQAYAQDYYKKLNMSCKSCRVNTYTVVPETDPYTLSYWDIKFKYKNKKGKEKTIKIGHIFEDDLNKEQTLDISFPFEKTVNIGKILKPILICAGVLAAFLIWYFFLRP